MNELLQSIPINNIPNWALLIISAILGTFFAYFRKWAWAKTDYPMLGDRRDRAKAITKLVGSLVVSLAVDMQTGMNTTAVIVLGIGIGLAVPVEVAKEEKKQEEGRHSGKSEVEA